MKFISAQTVGAFIVLVMAVFMSRSLLAHPNPQYRVCWENGAEFVIAQVGFDQIGLCKAGESYIGAIDAMNYLWEGVKPTSIDLYTSTTSHDCFYPQSVQTLEGANIDLCLFNDGSVMDYKTLNSGHLSLENSALNQFLGL